MDPNRQNEENDAHEKVSCKMESVNIHKLDKFGNSTICNMILCKAPVPVFEGLVSKGANLKEINSNGDSVLHVAVRREYLQAIKYFLTLNEDTTCKNKEGMTPIMEAAISAKTHFVAILNMFIKHGEKSDLKSLSISNNNAIQVDSSKTNKYLNTRLPNGASILHLAAYYQNVVAVNYLTENGFDPNMKCNEGKTPFFDAVSSASIEIIEKLKDTGTEINAVDNDGRNVLHHALLRKKSTDLLKVLVYLGANFHAVDNFRRGVVHYAIKTENMPALHFFLGLGADPIAPDKTGLTLMMYAVLYSNEKCRDMITLLNLSQTYIKKLNENFDHLTLRSLLMLQSSKSRDAKNARMRANLKLKTVHGESVLHLAAMAGNLSVADYLIAKGADVNCRANDGSTPLLYAPRAQKDFMEIVDLFVKHGADIKVEDNNGDNLLATSVFCKRSKEEILQLVKRGAIWKSSNKEGNTNLHYVVQNGDLDRFKTYQWYHDTKNCLIESEETSPIKEKIKWPFRKTFLNTENKNSHLKPLDKGTFRNVPSPKETHFYAKNFLYQVDDLITFCTNGGADIAKTNHCGQTPLHFTVDAKLTFIRWVKLLKEKGAFINDVDNNGDNLLCLAVRKGKSLNELKELIELGADWKIKTKDLETVLHLAANVDNLEVPKYFISIGANVNTRNKFGATPLVQASCSDSLLIQMIDLFVKHGGDINATDNEGENLIFKAIKLNRSVNTIHQLVQTGITWNNQNNCGESVLHKAAKCGNFDCLEYFVLKGADVNARDFLVYTPLLSAAFAKSENFINVVKLLVESGADINAVDNQHNNIMFLAASHGKLGDDLCQLNKLGAEYNALNIDGSTALHFAAKSGNVDAAKHLIFNDANVNAKNLYGYSPLLCAAAYAKNNYEEIIQLLIENGADIEAADKIGNNIVFVAVYNCKSAIELEILVNKGGNWKQSDLFGNSVLHAAVKAENCEALEYFISKGANISALNNIQLTPWWVAVLSEETNNEILKLLVELNQYANSVNNEGDNALFVWLQRKSSVECLKFLIDLGVTWKIRNFDGDSALHIAARFGNVESAQYLISLGANVNARNNLGETPFVTAAKSCNENLYKILKLLQQNRADINMVDNEGNNCFLIAFMSGRSKTELDYFVEFGVDLGAPNNEDLNALQQFANDGETELLEYFLDSDLSVK